MNSTDLGWAFLFLVIVGLMVAIGIVVGIIVAGRLDRLQAPRPSRQPGPTPPADPAPGERPEALEEEQHP